MNEFEGILALREAIKSGVLAPQTAIEASFDRAHASQARLKAFTYLPPTLSLADSACDPDAPLAGIAVAVKDLIDTADMPTSYGSPIYQGHQPTADAWIVQRLRQLGAHVLGKSVTTEFAWRHPGPTVNPWHPQHTPGGSSSGSAAAVAAGIVPLAIGTQTLGSVIRPAAFCGVVGFKPTYGAIARTGVCALSASLDHIGLFTRNVNDAIYAIRLLTGVSAEDTHGQPFTPFQIEDIRYPLATPPTIALLASNQLGEIDAAQVQVLQETAEKLRANGATVRELALPAVFNEAAALTASIAAADAAQHHAHHLDNFGPMLSPSMTELIEQGRAMSPAEIAALAERRQDLRQRYAQWLQENQIDALLLPPAQGEAPADLNYTGDARFCSPFTLAGLPAITLPAGFSPNGLPLGIQLVGASGQDLALLRVARWCEQGIAHPSAIADKWQ
ncbi:MAG TPA: amidase [Herbaspirillum sp.]|nr:amidase [Herbaspirillum sp.]